LYYLPQHYLLSMLLSLVAVEEAVEITLEAAEAEAEL
jgi:hypothetical protein